MRTVVKHLAMMTGVPGAAALDGHNGKERGVKHIPRCSWPLVVLTKDAIIFELTEPPCS